MKLLITGATGFLGYRTLEALAEEPGVEKITATGRSIKPTHFVSNDKVTYKLGDLSDAAFVEELVSDIDYVIHAAALSSPWGKYSEFVKTNVTAQQSLIAASAKYGIKRFIYISTPSLYFNSKDRFNISESDPLPERFINAYAKTKREAEIELERSSLPYIILRPRALTGRGDTVIMPRLIRAYEEGRLKIIGDGKNIVDLTSVANVVEAVRLSLRADEKALNQAYNITNGEPVLLWKSIETVLTLLHYQPLRKKIPYPLVKAVARLMEWKSRMTNFKEPVLTVYGVGTLAKSFTMDISKARRLLNYTPKVSTDEGIKEFVNWYLQK